MLDSTKEFLEEFGKLSKEEQEKRLAKMPLYMVELLTENGYEIYVHNGAPVVDKTPQEAAVR